jgi:insulysin
MVEFYARYVEPKSPSRAKLSVHLVAQRQSDHASERIAALLGGLGLEDKTAAAVQTVLSADHGRALGTEGISAALQGLGVAEDKIATAVEALAKEHLIDDGQAVPGNGTNPVMIKDVHEFKTGFQQVLNEEPFGNLSRFEMGAEVA